MGSACMKVYGKRNDKAWTAQIQAANDRHMASFDTTADYTAHCIATRQAGHDWVMACGWADRYDAHPMNAHHFYIGDMRRHANANGGSFIGNAGGARFTVPYWDARDTAWVNGASARDARAAGYRAMMAAYDYPAPFWAWWD